MRLSSRGVRRAGLALGCGLAVALVPAAAHARDVAYHAPAGCPSRAELVASIDARAPSGRPARVVIEKKNDGFHGEVSLGEGAELLSRTIEARTCGAVVEAVALIIALDSPEAVDSPAETNGPSAREGKSEGEGEGKSEDAGAGAVVAAGDQQRDAGPDATLAPAPPRHRLAIAIGAAFSGTTFEGQVLAGGSLFVDVGTTAGLAGVSFLQPSARLSFTRTLPNAVPRTPATTTTTATPTAASSGGFSYPSGDFGPEVTVTSAALDLCPVGAGLGGVFGVVACGHGELGSLEVTAPDYAETSRSRLWGAFGVVSRARLVVGSSGVRPMIEASAGLLVPTARDRFHVDALPTVVAPAVMFTGAVGVGLLLP